MAEQRSFTTGQTTESASEEAQRQQREAGEHARQAQAHARETVEDLKHKASDVARESRRAAGEMSDDAIHAAADTAQRVQQQCATFADDQKNCLAGEFETFGEAMSCAAERLRDDREERVAAYAELAAGQLHSTAEYLKSHEVGDLACDVEQFARRRPEIFFGGMLLAGLGIARFLKASRRTPGRREPAEERGLRTPAPQPDPYAEPEYAAMYTTQREPNNPLSYH